MAISYFPGKGKRRPEDIGTSPPNENTTVYQPPENVKFLAVTEALKELGRADEPHQVFRVTKWREYGPRPQ